MITKPKGTSDIYGLEAKKRAYVDEILKNVCESYNYNYVPTPVFEASELFHRVVVETTDIVIKETYTFLDRGNRSITLRPEGTAGIVRWFIENKLYGNMTEPVRYIIILKCTAMKDLKQEDIANLLSLELSYLDQMISLLILM